MHNSENRSSTSESFRARRLLGASALAGSLILIANPAAAQAQAPATAAVGIEEVIVTAQRRAETAQRAALALSVVSGEALQSAGVSRPEDLNKLVPGLKLTNQATTQIYIRGVGENSGNALGQSGVAVNVDGVYIGRVTAVAGNFFDLQRIEVLKGPQGTLYGRNATGGAINLITNKPGKTFGGNIQGEIGNFNLRRVSGAINVPINDLVATRLAFYDTKRDGYTSDGRDDEDMRAARAQVLFTPNDDVTLLVAYDGSQVGGVGNGRIFRGTDYIGSQESDVANSLRPLANNIPRVALAKQNFSNNAGRAQLDWNLGFGTLTVLPAFAKQSFSYSSRDINGSIESQGKSDQITGEARLGGRTERLKWVVGAYYFDEKVDFTYHGNFLFFGQTTNNYLTAPKFGTKSNAVFGEATFDVTEQLRVIFGGRHTNEKRDLDLNAQNYGSAFTPTALPTAGTTFANDPVTGVRTGYYVYNNVNKLDFDSNTGKIGLEFDLAPASLLYFTLASGFKSGGFSQSPPPQSVFQPEKLVAYTFGSKNRFLENRLQVNFEAFYWDYTNQQLAHQAPDINGAPGFITENAGASVIKGANLDVRWQPTRNDTFSAQFEYLKTRFKEFAVVSSFAANAATGCTNKPTTIFGRNAFIVDCSGLTLPFTPKWSGAVSYQHVFDLANGSTLTAGGSLQGQSRQALDVGKLKDPKFQGPGYIMADFDATYRAAEGHWSLTAYVRNALGQNAYNLVQQLGFSGAIPANLAYAVHALPPRTYGLRLGVQY